jgi:hypothetical protein
MFFEDTTLELVSKPSIRLKVKAARCIQAQEYTEYFEDWMHLANPASAGRLGLR